MPFLIRVFGSFGFEEDKTAAQHDHDTQNGGNHWLQHPAGAERCEIQTQCQTEEGIKWSGDFQVIIARRPHRVEFRMSNSVYRLVHTLGNKAAAMLMEPADVFFC